MSGAHQVVSHTRAETDTCFGRITVLGLLRIDRGDKGRKRKPERRLL